MPDVANPLPEFDSQQCLLLGNYFKNLENSYKNLNLQISFGENDLATLDPHFHMVKISWSSIVAPYRICSLHIPFCFVLFTFLASVSICSKSFPLFSRPRILKFIGQKKDSLFLLSAVTAFPEIS